MIRAILVLLMAFTFSNAALAANTPCSGSKGGVSHCAGGKFVCNDGSISASKKVCSADNSARPSYLPPASAPAPGNNACPCGSGNLCTGPRGGRYCLTPSGNKSYKRR